MQVPRGKKKSGYRPVDPQYLPIWVVLTMTFAVFVLSAQMTSVVKDYCAAAPARCDQVASARESVTPAQMAATAKIEAEARVAEAIAADKAAAAASPAPAAAIPAPDAKTK